MAKNFQRGCITIVDVNIIKLIINLIKDLFKSKL